MGQNLISFEYRACRWVGVWGKEEKSEGWCLAFHLSYCKDELPLSEMGKVAEEEDLGRISGTQACMF